MDTELRLFGLLVMWLGGVLTGFAIGRVTKGQPSVAEGRPVKAMARTWT